MNRAAAYFQLATLLAGGCIGVLAVGTVAAALGNKTLRALLVYGGAFLALLVLGLVMIGLHVRP